MPLLPQDVRDTGDNQSNPEVPNGTQRDRTAKGSYDNPKTKVRASSWPFRLTLEDNRWFVNRARKKRLSIEDDALF